MDKDFATISICALRYCYGRRTYMPSLVIDFIKKHWKSYDKQDRLRFLREVEQVLEYHKEGLYDLGMDCDIQSYQEFVDWIRSLDGGRIILTEELGRMEGR